jgi:hypothetical protein
MKDRIWILVKVITQIFILKKVMLIPVIRNTGSMKIVWHATRFRTVVTEKVEKLPRFSQGGIKQHQIVSCKS